MKENWLKYLMALCAAGALCGLLYYLYLRSAAPLDIDSDVSSALEMLDDKLPEFDFYKFLPEDEELVEPPPESEGAGDGAAEPIDRSGLIFQVGAYRDKREANRRRGELILLNLSPHIEPTTIDKQDWYRLRIGPIDGNEEFERISRRLADNNIDYFLSRPKTR